MQKDANIVLVGFMGTGKTTVGRMLAGRLRREFVDMDVLIEARERRPIPAIFRDSGEPYFRRLERALVRELAARRELVVAPGGGIVLDPGNLADFQRTGFVVCLDASPEAILRRVEHDAHRPLLAAPDKLGRIRELLAKRRPLYEAIPLRVDTSDLTSAEVVLGILDLFAHATV